MQLVGTSCPLVGIRYLGVEIAGSAAKLIDVLKVTVKPLGGLQDPLGCTQYMQEMETERVFN